MGEQTRGWLKGCSYGCGAIVLVAALIVFVVGVRTCVPLQSANRALERLEAQFGPPEAFTPPPDGAVPVERIEAFLGVREALMARCAEFVAFQGKMRKVDELEGETASGRELAGTTRGMAEVATGITPLLGEFFQDRNRTLLEAAMGLGEYTYIYAVAYREQLLVESIQEELFFHGGAIAPQVQTALREMLVHQRDVQSVAHGLADLREPLDAEIAAMEQDVTRLAWQDGLPAVIAESVVPYRERLDAAYCQSTAGIAMDRESGRALGIALY